MAGNYLLQSIVFFYYLYIMSKLYFMQLGLLYTLLQKKKKRFVVYNLYLYFLTN